MHLLVSIINKPHFNINRITCQDIYINIPYGSIGVSMLLDRLVQLSGFDPCQGFRSV